MVVGMNLTFGPMHIIGLQGQPRRMYVHTEARNGEGFFNLTFWNAIASIGAFILGFGVLIFFFNVWRTHWGKNQPRPAPLDPWDARSLEWMTTSPPKEHNFDAIPTVGHLDEFFHRKYEDRTEVDADGRSDRRRRLPPGRHRRGHASPTKRRTPTSTSTCRRRRTGRSCSPSACRSWPTA